MKTHREREGGRERERETERRRDRERQRQTERQKNKQRMSIEELPPPDCPKWSSLAYFLNC